MQALNAGAVGLWGGGRLGGVLYMETREIQVVSRFEIDCAERAV